jgi:MFS transporter, DHA2 family, multidrug resistance protein
MSYLGTNPPANLESWEQEEARFISTTLSTLSYRRKLTIMLSVGLVSSIEIANRLSINVLLPDMQGNVAANSDEISWVVILYNLGFLCSMALAYWMTRVLGAKRHLLLCIGLYAVGAMGCVLSPHNLESLLIARVIMGFGGGAFLVRTVILSGLLFPGRSRVIAVTWLYGVLFFFLISYPTAIGWISDNFHWNYAFLIDFPFLTLGAFLIWKFIPHGHLFQRRKENYVDTAGAVILITGMCCLQVAISRGERDEWLDSSWIVAALVVSIVCLFLFIWWETRPANLAPIFHLRMIWRQASTRASFGVVLIVGAILGAGLFVLPQYLRTVQDYSTVQTGTFISMFTLGLGLGDVITLRVLLPRIGGRRSVILGLALMVMTFASIIYIWTPTTPTHLLRAAIFLQGLSLAPALLGAANIATGSVAPVDLNDVSTMFFFVRQLGNTFGVTAATIIFDRRMTLHSSRLLDVANRFDPIVHSTLSSYGNLIFRAAGAASNPALGALQLFQTNVVIQSRLLSYIDIYVGLASLGVIGLILLAVSRFKAKLGIHFFHCW